MGFRGFGPVSLGLLGVFFSKVKRLDEGRWRKAEVRILAELDSSSHLLSPKPQTVSTLEAPRLGAATCSG